MLKETFFFVYAVFQTPSSRLDQQNDISGSHVAMDLFGSEIKE